MKTGTKILTGFGLAVAALLVIGGVAYSGAAALSSSLHDVADVKMPSALALDAVQMGINAAARSINSGLLRRANAEMRNVSIAKVKDAFRDVEAAIGGYDALPHGEEALRLWSVVKERARAWRARADPVLQAMEEADRLLDAGKSAEDPDVKSAQQRGWDAYLEERAAIDPAEKALRELQELTGKLAQSSKEQGAVAGARALAGIAAGIAIGVVLFVVLGAFLGRKIGKTVNALGGEARKLREAVAQGKLDVRGDVMVVDGEFRPVIEGINETMDAFVKPIAITADYVTRISKGDIPEKITDRYEGEFNGIKEALNRCIDSVSGLIGEMTRMSDEHDKGEIDAAVDVHRFEGAYRTMAQGVNDMVGAHLAVKRKAMGVFAEFGKGNFDATLEPLPGKKRFINDTIDQVRKNLKDLVAELDRMSSAHDAGDIDAAIEANRFSGAYRAMAEGVNRMVGGHIVVKKKAMACVAEFGRGNFEAPLERFPGKKAFINETIEQVRGNLKALIADADGLVQAALAGQLSTRADATKHQGDFRKIVDGVNKTLDAVMAPINEAAGVLEKLSQRDLRARVVGKYQGDHARIKESVNATGMALHDALAQVAQAVDQVSSASTQIAASSQAVASGASQQAASLEETTSSIEAVSSMTNQAAESASQANLLATKARTAATDGSSAVEQMQGAMGRIKASAEGTSQIIRDINDIAFQTNLLALNAAVEAARAGEAGRGFAVVAEEVRSLALRAKEAATKTEELIRQSVKEAVQGEVTATQVAGKLGEIASGVSKVSDIVAEIATGAQAQSTGIEQVSRAITEMDKVTQQNAASAEESSSAASELSGQAEELASMVAAFQLGSQAGTNGAIAPSAAPSLHARVQPRTPARSPRHGSPGVLRGAGIDGATVPLLKREPGSSGRLEADTVFPMDEASPLKEF